MKTFVLVFLLIFVNQYLFSQYKPIKYLTKEKQETLSYCTDENKYVIEEFKPERKSVFLAVIASLIVPGLGEWYAGSFESGKYHFFAECGLWLTYGGFRIHSNWVLNDSRTFAQQHAEANFSDKDDKYIVNIGNFNNTDEYNDTKAKNREYDLIYYYDVNPGYWWNWDTEQNRLRFKELRIRGDRIKNNAKFVIGIIAINHIVSAISAGRKTAAYNRSIALLEDIQINAYAQNSIFGIQEFSLNISTRF